MKKEIYNKSHCMEDITICQIRTSRKNRVGEGIKERREEERGEEKEVEEDEVGESGGG